LNALTLDIEKLNQQPAARFTTTRVAKPHFKEIHVAIIWHTAKSEVIANTNV